MKIEPIQGTSFDNVTFKGFSPVGSRYKTGTRTEEPIGKEDGLILKARAAKPEGVGENLDIIA